MPKAPKSPPKIEKLFSSVIKYFGILASSLTGISAVFTSIGYLAERSHLYALGFTSIPVDLNQYLYTGARFFALLPVIIISSLITDSIVLLEKYSFQTLIFLVLILVGVLLFKNKKIASRLQSPRDKILTVLGRWRTALLFFLFIFQLMSVFMLSKNFGITNLLFSQPQFNNSPNEFQFPASTSSISSWIVHNKLNELFTYVGTLFFLTFISGILFWFIWVFLKKTIKYRFWVSFWVGVNIFLFLTQVIFVPMNYGILLLPNKYQSVIVKTDMESELYEKIEDQNMWLLYQQNDDFYLYSGKMKKVLFLSRKNIKYLEYGGISDLFSNDSVKN